jgi:ankyrin repeat protein
MGIHEDARRGTLGAEELARYIQYNSNVLNEQDPVEGLTPLAAAARGGHADAVDVLLKKGAKADVLSSNGATPLLIATWMGSYNRARVVQLLLGKTPPASVDLTCRLAENNTPLMFAVQKNDVESVRLLVKAGASRVMTNNGDKNADELAADAPDKAVRNALKPDETSKWANFVALVMSVLLYIVAWVNDAPYADEAGKDVFQKMYKLSPGLDPELNKASTTPLPNGSRLGMV